MERIAVLLFIVAVSFSTTDGACYWTTSTQCSGIVVGNKWEPQGFWSPAKTSNLCCTGTDSTRYVAHSGRWVGAAPFCAADCSRFHSTEACLAQDKQGYGNVACWSGVKVLCVKKAY